MEVRADCAVGGRSGQDAPGKFAQKVAHSGLGPFVGSRDRLSIQAPCMFLRQPF